MTDPPRSIVEVMYAAYAQEYLRALRPENHMEAVPQATQRAITLASLALVRDARPDVHVFNELLVQYPRPKKRKPGQIVPDNMVVVHPGPIDAGTSYDVPLQPAAPFWVLEYVSKGSKRKDYQISLAKYEQELRVPYYLIFYPESQDLTLFRSAGGRYASTPPDADGRYPLPELELGMALVDGWVRFWFRGEMLQLPAELRREAVKQKRLVEKERRRADAEARRADAEARRAEDLERRVKQLEEELARARGAGGPA